MVWRKRAGLAWVLLCAWLLAGWALVGHCQPRLHQVALRWAAPTVHPFHLGVNASGTHAAVVLGYGLVGWMNLDAGAIERVLDTGRYMPVAAVQVQGNRLMIADNADLVGTSVIDLWDIGSWQRVRRIVSPQPISAATLSPNGQYIVTVGRDRAVRIWRTSDGTLLTTVYQTFIPLSVTFTADSTRIITGDDRGYLRMWTVSGTYLGIVRVLFTGVNRLDVSPSGEWLIVGAADAESRALGYNLNTNSIGWYAPYFGGVMGIAFSPNSTEVYIGSTDAYVYCHNLNTGQQLRRFNALTSVRSVSLAPNSSVVVAGSYYLPYGANFPLQVFGSDNLAAVQVWNTAGALLRTWRGDLIRPMRIAAARNGPLLAAGDFEGNLYLYDKATGQRLARWNAHGNRQVLGIALSASGQYLASCSLYELKVWEVSAPLNPTLVFSYVPNEPGLMAVALSPNGQRVAVANRAEGVVILENPSGNIIAAIQGGEERFAPTTLDIAPDNQTLVVGGRMQGVYFYNADTGDLLRTRETQDVTVRVQFSADGMKLLVVEASNLTYVVDVATDEILGQHGETWETACLTHDGAKVVAIRSEDSLVLWDYTNDPEDQYRRLYRFGRHVIAYGDVAVDSDGRTIYTSFASQGIAAWRLPSPADIDGSGCVDDADLLTVLFNFGATGANPADVNRDGTVDDADLLQVLFNFGDGC
jgi:WD40 repeat protein